MCYGFTDTRQQHCKTCLYDDFREIRPGAVEEYRQWLLRKNKQAPNDDEKISSKRSNISKEQNTGSFLGFIRLWWTSGDQNHRNAPRQSWNQLDQAQEAPPPPLPEDLFLLVCIPHKKWAAKLVHFNVNSLLSDQLFFIKLKSIYQEMRGRWTSFFFLKKLRSIRFVYFELYSSQLVDIVRTNDIPPEEKKHVYSYRPIPAEMIPPVGVNLLMHLYDHPEEAETVPVCLEKIPKKIRERLLVEPNRGTGLGWGIHLVEGLHWGKVCGIGLAGFLISILFGVLWSTLKGDIQGGFGVTACIMIIFSFVMGILQAALELK